MIIKAECHPLKLRVQLRQLQDRLLRHTIQRHIAGAFPVLRMQADVGQQIDGRLKYKQVVGIWILRNVMKAVGRMAALNVDAESAAGYRAFLMGMTGTAFFKHNLILDFGLVVNQDTKF